MNTALQEHGTTFTELGGIDTVLAARVLAHTGPVDRFPSDWHDAAMPVSPLSRLPASSIPAIASLALGTDN